MTLLSARFDYLRRSCTSARRLNALNCQVIQVVAGLIAGFMPIDSRANLSECKDSSIDETEGEIVLRFQVFLRYNHFYLHIRDPSDRKWIQRTDWGITSGGYQSGTESVGVLRLVSTRVTSQSFTAIQIL